MVRDSRLAVFISWISFSTWREKSLRQSWPNQPDCEILFLRYKLERRLKWVSIKRGPIISYLWFALLDRGFNIKHLSIEFVRHCGALFTVSLQLLDLCLNPVNLQIYLNLDHVMISSNGGNSNGKSMKTMLKTNRPQCEVLLLSADFSPGYNFSSRLQAAAMLRLFAEGGMMIKTGKSTSFVCWRRNRRSLLLLVTTGGGVLFSSRCAF